MKITIILSLIILFSELVRPLHVLPSDKFKNDAIAQMNAGRYGEAIELLNKYVSANPQNSEGYYLRGICYESRGQYEYAVYDLRSASKLNQKDTKVSVALSRVTDVWYSQLYNKIEGHKREIAINPNSPIDHLEIGKSYKNLGNWAEAEKWYDKYLALEDPSADEVIRYTEILAKNNHIVKGEIILKKFVEKYPEDHRLWSRYGYFTLWLGKNKTAIAAFSEALKFRPFFKEAIDGLNLAQGKGAVYIVNDTSYRYNKWIDSFRKTRGREYPIDRYFRILRINADNDSVRILLISELIKVNRFEEAKQQIKLLNERNVGKEYIKDLEEEVNQKMSLYLRNQIEKSKLNFSLNPSEKKAASDLTNYYSLVNDVDSMKIIYFAYLNRNPNDESVRFEFAKRLTWFKEFDEARQQVDFLLKKNPNKTEYQLLRAQIAVWTNSDNELAIKLLNKVLENEPHNIQALNSLAVLSYQTHNFTKAEGYIEQIKSIDPNNNDVKELENNLYIHKKQYEESELFRLVQNARNSLNDKKCAEAISYFKEYLTKAPEDSRAYLELANAYICQNDYPNAIKIYSSLLEKQYDYDLAKQRANLYFWSGDSLNALREFKSLSLLQPDDAEVKLFLADSYFKIGDYNSAKKIYTELLDESPSSMLIKNRLSWLPQETDGSFTSFISNFPSYTLITPEVFHFHDNLSFKYNFQGLRLELGFPKIISIGGSVYRGDAVSDSIRRNFYTVLGNLAIIPAKQITFAFSYGTSNYLDYKTYKIAEISLKSEIKDRYSIVGKYRFSDAIQSLYSPYILDTNLNVNDYSIEGMYLTPTQMILSGLYSFKKISDENYSKTLLLRLGRKFDKDFTAGYEYNSLNYNFESPLYYSPGSFESHSLWADYDLIQDEVVDFSIGGKLGLITNNDFLIKEFNSKILLKLFESFTIQGQIVYSENARETLNYRSTSASVMAFWVF